MNNREIVTFGTKAETLARLAKLVRVSSVPKLLYVSAREWDRDPDASCALVASAFQGSRVAVRSSAAREDGSKESLAGAFATVLNIDSADSAALRSSVGRVVASYRSREHSDQILFQRMVDDVAFHGVVLTYDLETSAPYYSVEYDDSGRTDAVTGGKGACKSWFVFRGPGWKLHNHGDLLAVIRMVREVECLTAPESALDLEFARTKDGELHLLQVRAIATIDLPSEERTAEVGATLRRLADEFTERSRPAPYLSGERTLLGKMPDWNPAELIGVRPRPLAVDLFRTLITDRVWQQARAGMGYRAVPDEPLMTMLAGTPYIDVRKSFNSFLPAGLPDATANVLVNVWIDRLAAFPEYHDKVEFGVVQTVADFQFDEEFRRRFGEPLAPSRYRQYRALLFALTVRAVSLAPDGSLARAEELVCELEALQASARPLDEHSPLHRAVRLVDECTRLGSLPFAVIARHAFIAEALLRSAARSGAIDAQRLAEFKASVQTVTTEMASACASVIRGALSSAAFFERYGHLRPGSFDIRSPRYDRRGDFFEAIGTVEASTAREPGRFVLTPREREALRRLLGAHGIRLSSDELFIYAARAIAGRERAKFVFTRHLSEAMECIAEWGAHRGLSRDELSYQRWLDLRESLDDDGPAATERLRALAIGRRAELDAFHAIRLACLIRDAADFYAVPRFREEPNFVTALSAEAEVVLLRNDTPFDAPLRGKIVLIESADPGFDWVFLKGIKGMVTMVGGSNSHMTIRCAERGVPAAIGVGEPLFHRLATAKLIELRCVERIARPIYG